MDFLKRTRIVAITLVLIIINTGSLFAEKGIFFGTRAGYIMSSSTSSEMISENLPVALTHYFQAGGTITFGIFKRFAIHAEFLYSRQQAIGIASAKEERPKWKSTAETNNLSIPLGLQIGNKVYFELGASLEIPLSGVLTKTLSGDRSTHYIKRYKELKDNRFRMFDVMPYFGIGWCSKIGFGVSARASVGVMDLDFRNIAESVIPWNFQVAVTYKFGLKSMYRR